MAIPDFQANGTLPPGVHEARWDEFLARFATSPHRQALANGLARALRLLARAGCRAVYVNGSFVTDADRPADWDASWDPRGVDPSKLDRIFIDFRYGTARQKEDLGGEIFISELDATNTSTFLEFFQTNKTDGSRKGIILLEPMGVPDGS